MVEVLLVILAEMVAALLAILAVYMCWAWRSRW